MDGNVTVTVSGNVDTNTAGTYTVTYTASDTAGNIATATRTITVQAAVPQDTTAPTITLNGAQTITLTVGDTYTEEGASAQDDVDGNVTVTVSGNVDTNTADTYTVTYTATDRAGNTGTATRTVTVQAAVPQDTTAPTITLNGAQTITLTVGDTYTEEGATAQDDVDGDITSKIVIGGDVNTSKAGTYLVTYNVSDTTGNLATEVTRTVVINQPVSSYTMADITALLEAAAQGSNTNVKYVVIHDSNRDNVPSIGNYYTTMLGKIGVGFVEEYKAGNTSILFLQNASNGAGSSTLASLKANPSISLDGSNTIIEFGLGRNDRNIVNDYAALKAGIKNAVEAIGQAKPKAMILLVTPKEHPVDDMNQNANGKNDLRRAYAEVAQELSLPLLDMKGVSAPSVVAPDRTDYYPLQKNGTTRSDYYYKDNIHFNESGGRRVVNYIFSAIGGPSVFTVMTMDEFADAGSDYNHKTIADINKGLQTMNLHPTVSSGSGKSLWFAFKNVEETRSLNGTRVNFIKINTNPSSLVYTDGTSSTVTLQVSSNFSGLNGNSYAGASDDVVPLDMLKVGSWFVGPAIGNSTKGTIRFGGLNAGDTYRIELGAIRTESTDPNNRTGIYTINGTLVGNFNASQASGSNSKSLVFSSVSVTANGEIVLDVESETKWSYLGWLKLIKE